MPFDIYCPYCGDFQDRKNVSKGCPRCGNKQAISLYHREDIDARFKLEKDNPLVVFSVDGTRREEH